MDVLVESDGVRISILRGNTDRVFVAFTGIRHGLGGIGTEEFIGTTSDAGANTALFVTDLKRTWYNDRRVMDETVRILGDLHRTLEPKLVVSLGNSMGGFGAILLSKLTRVDVAVSFVPQFSVHPKIVPKEKRWLEFTRRIRDFVYPDLSDCFVSGTSYYIFTGSGPAEEMHYSRIPQQPNVHCLVFPNAGHDVAAKLKSDCLLKTLIKLCAAKETLAVLSLLRERYGAFDADR